MRLDKFLSQYTDYSRSQIQQLVKANRVAVNGELIKKADHKLNGSEQVMLDNRQIEAFSARYIMLYKPLGYVCANSDSEHPVVLDLLDMARKLDLQIAGRLDIDTTGLVLLTDDGQWNHRITAPKQECTKTYLVTTADPIHDDVIQLFAQGIQLHGEKNLTRPAQLGILSSHTARLQIHEGKYHQVKRMFAATGNRVVQLHRESIGAIQLDPALAPGEYRALTKTEIQEAMQ
jgi:16S rRNA pseudouridine516 synthase